jgi:GcrA cell cycle regulator
MNGLGLAWTEQRINEFRDLWAAGLTAAQIAAQLGVTRNAVLGKRMRLKLPERLRAPPATARNRPKRLYARKYPSIKYRERPAEVVFEVAQSVPCSLIELDTTRCHWPVGEPENPDFHFCGGAAECGSYCGFHYRVAYQKPVAKGVRRKWGNDRGGAWT